MSNHDGGYAFPTTRHENGPSGGLSALDYFAAHAPISLGEVCLASGFPLTSLGKSSVRADVFRIMRDMRYEYAANMLAERANLAKRAEGKK